MYVVVPCKYGKDPVENSEDNAWTTFSPLLCPIAPLIYSIFDTMYHTCTISDILRQGVDSLAQWLEHWISTPAVRVRIPSGTWDFFKLCIIIS